MSRVGFLILCSVVVLALVLGLSGVMLVETLFRLLSNGPVLVAWAAACVGVGMPLARKIGKGVVDHVAIAFATGVGLVGLVTLGLGLLGWLTLMSAWWILFVGIAIGGASLRGVRQGELKNWLAGKVGPGHFALLLAVGPVAVMLVGGLVLPGILWGDEPHGYDVVSYHLQLPREWFEAGQVSTASHNVFSFFPFNVEMHYLLAMHLRGGPWAGMYLAQWMHGAMAVAAAVAVFGMVRDRGAFVASSSVALMLCVPFVPMLGSVAYNEAGLLLFAVAALRCAMGGSGAMSGLMSGFAIGCKLTAIPMVAVPTLILLFAKRTGFRSALCFLIFTVVASGPWLIRNAIITGNPVFPIMARQLGGPFDAKQVERFEVAHAPRADQRSLAGRATAFCQQVLLDWKLMAIVLLVLIAPAGFEKQAIPLWLGLLVIALTWLLATHLQGRFFIVGLPIIVLLVSRVNVKRWPFLVCVACVAMMGRGHEMFTRIVDRQSLIGFEQIEQLPDLTFGQGVGKRLIESRKQVVLVGDARAFWVPIPSDRLRYNTVFDIRDWPEAEVDRVYLVSPGEIDRLSRTYRHVPEPPNWLRAKSAPFMVGSP